MRILKTVLALVSKKTLAKYLPKVLAYVLTKGLGYVIALDPKKAKNIIKETTEVLEALKASVNAAKDGIITEDELEELQKYWRKAIEM